MFSPKTKLEVPDNFDFPFEPYEIQKDLMKSLYSVLENKQIGIFESPTGTGKSLTLATSSIRWLFDHNDLINREIQEGIKNVNKEIKELEEISEKDWIKTQSEIIEKKGEATNLLKLNKSLKEQHDKIKEMRERVKFKGKENFNLNNIQDKSINLNKNFVKVGNCDHSENENSDDSDHEENEDVSNLDVKIFYCSRTHSQLSQVVKEVKRTNFGKEVRCISLASRQNLCVNQEVRKLNSVHLINEKCIELQKGAGNKTQRTQESPPNKKARKVKINKCSYKTKTLMQNLRDLTISTVLDIEDLVLEGKRVKACPYYTSRLAIKDAQLVMLPYQMLFHRSTRLQSGISLDNNIVIIDEAHNLLDAISNIYSSSIELLQLNSALIQLTKYKEMYFPRFNTKNLLKINQIIFIVKRLIKIMDQESKIKSKMIKTHELMSEGDFYNINIFEILEFCENTHFAEKVHSFAQKQIINQPVPEVEQNEDKLSGIKGLLKKMETDKDVKHNKFFSKTTTKSNEFNNSFPKTTHNVIRPLLSFLDCLTECADDGGIIIQYNDNKENNAAMKFVLLNPARHFKDIIEKCRSIVIAGGTMQPINELTNQLFTNYIERVRVHIYGHVVAKESILPITIANGPSGKKFLLNFQNRNSPDQLNELAQTIFNICNIIPAGIVCFVPSYDYLDNLWSYLETNNYLTRIESKKFVFREMKSNILNDSIDKLLTNYSRSIKNESRNGAFIFSVVGGKLSEGLNFADDMGRCIIVIGLPYPNKTSFELQEKMKYLDEKLGKNSGNEYYENLCLKAVNQCIGRSIRHIRDYAVVLLIDERYTQDKVIKKLPGWISRSLQNPQSYGKIQKSIVQFFKEKKQIN